MKRRNRHRWMATWDADIKRCSRCGAVRFIAFGFAPGGVRYGWFTDSGTQVHTDVRPQCPPQEPTP